MRDVVRSILQIFRARECSICCVSDRIDCATLTFALLLGITMGHAQANSTSFQACLQRAQDALATHNLDAASHAYAEALTYDPRSVEAHTGLGIALYGMGKPKEAAAELHASLQLDPSQKTAQLFLALSDAGLGQCGEAIPQLNGYLHGTTEPKLRRVVGLNLMICYENGSDLNRARDVAQALNESFPDDAEILFHLAEVYSRLLDTTVNELLKKHPDSYRFHQIAGETLEAENNAKQAVKEYRRALEINPRAISLHYRIGKLLLTSIGGSEGDAQALVEFRKELETNPADSASEYQIGEILLRDHRTDESRESYQRALELSPDFTDAHIGLAKVELNDHQPTMAVKELERAIQLEPTNPSAHYALMLAYRDLGEKEQATSEMEVFRNLKSKEDTDFRSKLQALLAEGDSSPDKTP